MVRFFVLLIMLGTLNGDGWSQGIITTLAGNGVTQYIGDGWPATAYSLAAPMGLCADQNGNIYEADFAESRIRKVNAQDTLFTIAGIGVPGYAGDGGPATLATFANPTGVVMDTAGNLFITEEYNNIVRKINRVTGQVSTVCGTGTGGYAGDGGPATAAMLDQPGGLCLDKAGNIYIADKNNNRIRKVDRTTGIISTYAGNGTFGYSGDGGAADATKLAFPRGVSIDTLGNIYIADFGNHRVRKVDAISGNISTVAGTGSPGYAGNNGPAIAARLTDPHGVYVSRRGNLYIADYGNNVVRVVTPDGVMHTVAGSGLHGYSGDAGAALSATMQGPTAVCTDQLENLYIADWGNSAIRKVTPVYTGIDEAREIGNIMIYPVPASDVLYISLPAGKLNSILKILDPAGRTVYEQAAFAGGAIPVSHLANGVYGVSLTDGESHFSGRFIILR
jgi:streptogramin lyase